MQIEIIGSIDSQQHYSTQHIKSLLEKESIELNYGADFMGRPGTQVYAGNSDVIKLRLELDLQEDKARRFITHTLTQEQKLRVHHPQKTWFLIELEAQKFRLGNICPRLIPIHTLEKQQCKIAEKIEYLKKIYCSYFYIAHHFGARLDEGLSNFGINDNKQLYYLDDDIYKWDNFVSFAHLLGVLIRNNDWLNDVYAQDLGITLQQLITEFFEDTHTCFMVARQLRDIFMPDNDRKKVLNIIIEQLEQNKIISKKLPSLISQQTAEIKIPSISQPQQEEVLESPDTIKTKNTDKNFARKAQDYLAILSDVHANLPALEAVLDFLNAENISQGMVLGDIIGYGPHPIECIERLQKTQLTVIKGNHDHAAVIKDNKRGMSSTARWCIEWTIPHLREEHLKWLTDLPLELTSADDAEKSWRAMHGAPIDPNYFYAYVYQMTYEQNLEIMAKKNMDYCFHGHSHIQGLYVRDKQGVEKFLKPKPKIDLTHYQHALICSGAVGQPRDGCTGAQFALYNQRSHELKFVVVKYDMNRVLHDLEKYQFPEMLAERLQKGI